MDNKTNSTGPILALIIIALLAIGVYFWQTSDLPPIDDDQETEEPNESDEDKDEDDNEDDNTDEENDPDEFSYDEENDAYYGTLTATGYLVTNEVNEPFCEEDCATYTYASFVITETNNESLKQYIDEQLGNSFVGESSIGIGCVDENEMIWRENDSDEFGMQEYRSSESTSAALLASSEENPVTITAERYLYTSGRGAPACYSHFANVEVVE